MISHQDRLRPVSKKSSSKKISCDQERLVKGGIGLTANRKRVFDVITSSAKALTPKTILARIRESHAMDKVTLYRTLDLFVTKKIIRRIAGQHGQVYYEIMCEDHRPAHSHFVCRECGDMECLEDLLLKELKIRLPSHGKWEDNEIDLKLEGVCGDCKKGIN